MLQPALFADKTPYRKFLILVGLTLIGSVLFTILGGAMVGPVFGLDILNNPNALSDFSNPSVIQAMLLIQGVAAFGTFILPAYGAAYLFDPKPFSFLQLDRKAPLNMAIQVVLLVLVSGPFINWMMSVNGEMHLPAGLKSLEDWMKASEESAKRITEAFLSDTGIGRLFANLLIIAIIPAIGEELLFRGVIQKLFKELTGNIHFAIVLSAVLFSALHMQFYGFLPRFALGVLLGYCMLWSGSLWLPILVHLLNNSMAILFSWLSARQMIGFNPDTLGLNGGEEWMLGISVFMSWGLVFMLSKAKVKQS